MVTRAEVLELVDDGLSYEDAGARLGIHPGLAYMIATGLPADGSDALSDEDRQRPGFLATTTVHLANPAPVHNPTHHDEVQHWIAARVAADDQMQHAGARHWPAAPELGDTGEDPDVVAVLARDHTRFHELATQLEVIPKSTDGATARQVERRAAVVDALRVGLGAHEAAEAEHFWPLVRERLGDGDALADEGRSQEEHAAALFGELAGRKVGGDDWEQVVTEIQHALRAHVALEDRMSFALRDATRLDDRRAAGTGLARAEGSPGGPS